MGLGGWQGAQRVTWTSTSHLPHKPYRPLVPWLEVALSLEGSMRGETVGV